MSAAAFPDPGGPLNPFPGLRPFEPEEDYLFFGRERQTDELVRKLRATRFLSILGRSGSGKSSLVRSGLIPTLWGGGMTMAGSRWRVAIARPGEDPIRSLAAALSARGVLFDEDVDEGLMAAFFETTLRAGRHGLVECIRQARLPAGNNVLILVDQFEELFRYKRSRRIVGRDEAAAFVKLLLTARESAVACYVVITMRSDFVGDCMEFGQLPEVINEGIYLVPRMSRDELKAAITGPVGVGGGTIEPRLVSRLLNDVGDDPDQLPLLQHALMRTWDHWQGDRGPREGLDLRHYEAIGTLDTALSRHAEEAFSELDARQQKIAERMFKALTDMATDARGVRRPAPLREICAVAGATLEEVVAVAEPFRRHGRSFLMPPYEVPLHETSVLDISHESLMRIWTRLKNWADEEARAGQLYLTVARAAERHAEGTAALWRDPELQLALTWREKEHPTAEWAGRYDSSFARAMAFLDASREERDRETREREEHRRRRLQQARRLAMVMAFASLAMLAVGGYAFMQKESAVDAAVEAERQRRRAVIVQQVALRERDRAEQQRARAEQQQQLAMAEQQRAETERARAAERTLFAEAQRVKAESNEREAQAQKAAAEVARQQAVTAHGVAVTERQKAIASATETRRLSRLDAARALALTIPQQREEAQRTRSALLALEAYRLYRDNSGDLRDPDLFMALHTALDRLRPATLLRGGHAAIRALAVAPGGRVAFGGSEDGQVVRFDLENGKTSRFGGTSGAIRTIAVAADGSRVAAGSTAGELRVFDARNPASSRQLGEGGGVTTATAFAPGGGLLAEGKLDGTLRVWNLDDAAAAPVSLGGTGGKRVTGVAFGPDGAVAAGLAQGGALIWSLAAPLAPPRVVCAGLDVRSIAFHPNGGTIACGGGRGQIVQQSLRGNDAPITLAAHRSSVNSLGYDRRGAMLTSASSDGTVRLWEAGRAEAQPIVLSGHDSWVWAAAFSGDRVISGGEDRTVRVWPANTEILAAELCRALETAGTKQLTREEWSRYMPPDLEYAAGCPAAGRKSEER